MSYKEQTISSAESPTEPLSEKKLIRLNAFSGAFLPAILSILGVVLYLRLGWIVGSGGIYKALLIISLAFAIALITTCSISATVSNMKIGSGGIYYMLSKAFGLEAASAIAYPLYFAQAIGISFYISGISESLSLYFPSIPQIYLSLMVLIVITFSCLFSTAFLIKAQYLIFALLALALISIFCAKPSLDSSHLPSILPQNSFWLLFPIFFPAVTGIESGLGMAGYLKNPSKDIPKGTIYAVLCGVIIYIFLVVFIHNNISHAKLISNPLVLQEISRIKEFFLLGLWGAALSTSMFCMIGAPRSLRALSSDGIAPSVFKNTLGHDENPRVAILFTALIAAIALFYGDINKIALLLSMFFLLSYATLNLAVSLEGFFENPSWRPTFSFSPWISLTGFILCVLCMLMMSVTATIFSLILVGVIFLLLKRRLHGRKFDDLRQSILLFMARYAIYRLPDEAKGPKSWRPNLLAFVGDPLRRDHLIEFSRNLTHGKGFLSFVSIYSQQEITENLSFATYENILKNFFHRKNETAILEIKKAPTVVTGMKTLLHQYGIGNLMPNTIVLGATQKKEYFSVYAEVILEAYQTRKNVIIVKESSALQQKKRAKSKCIDVWWGGQNRKNSDLILVLAYMLQTCKEWKGSKLHLKSVVTNEKYRETMKRKFLDFSYLTRIRVFPEVVISKEEENVFTDTILQSSKKSDLVFMGLRPPKAEETIEEYAKYYETIMLNTLNYPPVAFVLAGETFEFGQILQ